MDRNIVICGYNLTEAEGNAMIFINYARDNDMKVSFVPENSRRVHVRLGDNKSRFILKGDADLLIASDVYEAVKNVDYLRDEGRLHITEKYTMTDERYMQYSKRKCYDYLKKIRLL